MAVERKRTGRCAAAPSVLWRGGLARLTGWLEPVLLRRHAEQLEGGDGEGVGLQLVGHTDPRPALARPALMSGLTRFAHGPRGGPWVVQASFAVAVRPDPRPEPALHRHELDLRDRLVATGLDRQDLELVLGGRLEELRRDGDTGRARREVDTEHPERILSLDDDLIADDLDASWLVARLPADHGIVGSDPCPRLGCDPHRARRRVVGQPRS